MTSWWKKAGESALTLLSCWLARISASPEAAHFGGMPTASSALAQESCGQGVRARAQLLRCWDIALERAERLHGQTAEQRNQCYSHAPPWAVLTYLRFLLSPFRGWGRGEYRLPPGAAIPRCREDHRGGGHRHGSLSAGSRDLHLHRGLKTTVSPHAPYQHPAVTRPDPAPPRSSGRADICRSALFARSRWLRSWAPQVSPGTAPLSRQDGASGDFKLMCRNKISVGFRSFFFIKDSSSAVLPASTLITTVVYTTWRKKATYCNINVPITRIFTKKNPSRTRHTFFSCATARAAGSKTASQSARGFSPSKWKLKQQLIWQKKYKKFSLV